MDWQFCSPVVNVILPRSNVVIHFISFCYLVLSTKVQQIVCADGSSSALGTESEEEEEGVSSQVNKKRKAAEHVF